VLTPGKNEIRAITEGKEALEDCIEVEYQTQKWGEEDCIKLSAEKQGNGLIKIDVQLVDKNGTRCLDSKKVIWFEIAGSGKLICNQGTAGGSSKVQASNGHASIMVENVTGKTVVAVKADDLKTQFITIE
jgi:beta-galactosidase